MDYHFEEVQNLMFVVYDVDDSKHVEDLSRHDLIGQIQCSLADIVIAGQQYRGRLKDRGLLLTHVQHFVLALLACCVS